MSLVGFQRFQDFEGGGCPTITLGDLSNGLKDTVYSDSVAPSGGQSPYNLSVTIGTLPTGLSLNSATGAITGTPTVFESQTFTIGGTEANGCAITPKEYTVQVWKEFIYTGPTVINDGSANYFLIPVSGIDTPYAGNELVSVEVDFTYTDLAETQLLVANPDNYNAGLYSATLSGTALTNAIFYNNDLEDNPPISGGSNPYTGTWSPESRFEGVFTGMTTTGNWAIVINTTNTGGSSSGTFNSAKLIFKPVAYELVEFENNTPVVSVGDPTTDISVTVSGLNPYYIPENLVSVEVSATIGDLETDFVNIVIEGGVGNDYQVLTAGPLTGANLTNTIFYNSNIASHPDISTGTAPYNGTWNDTDNGNDNGFDNYFATYGLEMNVVWKLKMANLATGMSINSVKFTFKNWL